MVRIRSLRYSHEFRAERARRGHSSPGVCDGGGREGVVDSAGSPTSIQVERRPPPNLPRAADVAGEEPLTSGAALEKSSDSSGSGPVVPPRSAARLLPVQLP